MKKYSVLESFRWRFIRQNLVDFAGSFLPVPTCIPSDPNGKKILIFNWRDTRHEFAGGAEVYIHELAKEWVSQGHCVTVFCGNDSHSLRNESIDGVQIVRRGGFYFVYVWAFLYYMLNFKGKYDVIIDSQNGIPFFTPLYTKEPTFSLLHHVHQEVFRQSLIKPLANLASFLESRCMPLIYRNTPFLTVSESSKKEIVSLGLGRKGISIIHPGVDLAMLTPAMKSKRPLVLYLGRMKYYKRLDVLLRAAKDILAKDPTVRFVLAGDGEYKKNLKKMATRLGIEENIEFVGRVSEEQKAMLYAAAWVVVNPSMMEGWGITTIEANACGTPVIASDVPGLRDSVKNGFNGYLFELGNHHDLTKKIRLLLTHTYLRTLMSKNSVEWAKRFDWKVSAGRCLNVIARPAKPKTVSIGIPAYNEGRNIGQLVTSLLKQKEDGFILQDIVIISDGSSDATVDIVKTINDKRITILDDGLRLGKSARMNQLLKKVKSDVVFLIDADIAIPDTSLFANVLKDSDIQQIGVFAVRAEPLPGRTFFEKCINHSVSLQNDIRKLWNHGDNYLAFRGAFLALDGAFAKKLHLDESIYSNDAYIYFKAKELNYFTRYLAHEYIYYRSPAIYSDHLKQSSRFQNSAKELAAFFPYGIDSAYSMPKSIVMYAMLKNALKNPVYFTGFLMIYLRAKLAKPQNLKRAWNIAVSTKAAN